MKKRSAPRRQLLVEELEPRILYSADVATLFGAGLWTPGAEVRVVETATSPASSPQPAVATVQQSAREIVFIDSRVPDAIKLADELMQQRGNGRTFDIVMLNAADDGIAQINRVLAGEHDLTAIHIISHGSAGALQLGSSLLDADELSRNSTAVTAWGRALSTDGDLLLYGCDVGQGAVGRAFISQLAQLTGADVAASNNRTGSAVSGGDWTLEMSAGAIETAVALDADVQGVFAGALDITTGLKGLWQFDADATDASGNGYNGTLTNGALIDTTAGTNKVGAGKVSLDGANDYVDLSAHLASFSSLSQGTISAWIKTSQATDATIFELSDIADTDSYAAFWLAGGQLRFSIWEAGTGQLSVTSTATVNDNAWHHVAVTVDATGNKLYIDGVAAAVTRSVGSAATQKFFSSVTGVDFMAIGGDQNSNGLRAMFTGLIDDVRVYDRALSASDIAELASAIAVNAAPVNTVPGAQSTSENTAKVFSAGTGNQISIADADTSGPYNKVTLSVTNGSLTLAGTTGLTFAAGDGSADTTMTFWGTVANINTALNGLSYSPTANYNGSAVLTMTTFDSAQTPSAYNYRFQDGTPAGNSAVNIPSSGGITGVVSNFDVTALATALTGSIDTFGIIYTGSLDIVAAGTYTFYVGSDDGSILSIDGAAVVSNDGNHIYLEKSGTKMLTAGTHAIEIRYFEDVGTQQLTANYAGPDTGAVRTTLVASSTTSTVNLTVIPTVNVAPVNNVPGAQSTNEDTAKVFSSGNGNQISIADPDGTSNEQVTLSVTNGSLTLAGTTGLTFTAGDGSADATMTFRGTVAGINTALNGLSYGPTANYNGSASLTMTTIDSGIVSLDIDAGLKGRYTFDNPGDLGNDTSPLGANDGAPNLGTSATNDGTRGAVIAMTGVDGGGVQVTGLMGSPTNVTLAAWVNLTAADTGGAEIISLGDSIALRADNGAGAGVTGFIYNGTSYANITSGTYIAGTGWHHLAYTFDDTGNVNKLYIDGNLVASAASTNSISYTKGVNTQIGRHGNNGNSFDFNGKMDEVRVFDRALTAAEIKDLAADLALQDADSVAITVNAGNDAPVVTITPSSYAAIEQTPLVLHGTGLSVADADAAAAAINLTLSVGSGNLTVGAGTTGASTSGSGTNSVLVIGTLAQLNNLLAGNLGGTITYLNPSDAPPASTTFTLSVNDGGATGAGGPKTGQDTAVINITATNDAPAGVPTITGTPTEDQTLTANTAGISDADGLGTFSYQWLRGGSTIGGATASAYTLGDADVGAQISVQVSYTDGGGTAEGPLTSALTAAVTNVNDAPVGIPTISGTASKGQTLTANTGGISDADGLGAFSYQWLRGGAAIGGATGSTYLLVNADVGTQITVQVSYTDGHGTAEGPLTSAPTAVVTNVNTPPSGLPTISGPTTEDQTLTANTAGISDADGLGAFSYQWLRNGSTIGGATASTYTLGDADVGTQFSVEVHYTDGGGTAEGPLTSTPVGPVANVNDAPVGVPTISGTATEDQTLTANTAGISDADGLGAFSYQWLRNGSTIGGATGSTYLLVNADVGTQITVQVTYTDGHGTAEGPLTSAPTALVTNVNNPSVGLPTISGTATENQTLTANTAGISDADGLGAFSYQWLRNGSTIGGATGSTYLLVNADVGTQVSVQVTYIDSHGTAEGPLTSAPTALVTNVNNPPVGIPTISGTPTEDQTLTANTAGISDADGLGTFSYQWLRGGVAIGGATASTYTLGDADVGAQISVEVRYTDGGGTAEGPLTSTPVGPVANVNDTPVGVPTISGTATEDQTLTANTAGISDADGLGAFSYQWLRGGVAIGGATASTYTLGDADVGAQISVQVSYTDGGGTAEGPLTSASVGPVANVNDAPVGVPTISGTATEDQTLTANTAGISDADGLGAFSYQWLRNGSTIGGATGSTYLLVNADVGTQITVQVTYTDGHGTAEGPLTSAPTALVTNVNNPSVGLPTISGTATENQTLTANTAGISDADGLGAFSYQWLRNGSTIGGATANTYSLGDADVGAQISVRVTYTDGGGTAEGPLTSASVGPVANVNDAPAGVPAITGTASKGQTLTAEAIGISDADGLGTFNYQWLRGGVVIGGATGSTYLLVNADVGTQITVQVTYTDGHGTAEGPLTSAPTALVTNVNTPPSGVPTISGTPEEDQTLTANTTGISDVDGLGAFSYQWLRNGLTIGGATASTYTLGDADVGTQLSVEVRYTDGGGTAEGPLTSTQVGPVANVNDAPVGVPAITGTATEDQTLSANTAGISDADGLGTFSYQWLRDGSTIGGATANTYLLGDADVGAQISVQVSYTDGGGTAEGPLTSASVGPVANINDAPAGLPAISGTATEDQTLSANTAGISDADGLGTFSYQWLRNGSTIGGATAHTYLLGDADVGAQLSVEVRYTDGGGTAEGPLTSALTAAVANINDAPVGVPTISGTVTEDQTLTANTAGISDADGLGTFSYQWLRNGSTIGGATASTYTLGDADVGTQFSVEVHYTDGGGTAEGPLTSVSVGPVANVNDAPVGVPTISGTASKGQTLTADASGISDADGLVSFSYQWLRGGVAIGGATGSTYLLVNADVGTQITVQVSYTDGYGTAEGPLTSAPTALVTNVNTPPSGLPTITGTATEDQTLSANTAGISDADGLGAFSYQWLRGGVAIGGATASTYTLGDADVGAEISVQVSYSDGGGTAEGPLTSVGVGPVANVNDAPAGVPTISGTASKGQTLTANTGGISDADGLGAFSYQWLRGGVAIGGATGSTYLLVNADVGTQISVQVSYTDGHGTAEGPLTSAPTALVTNVNTPPSGLPTITGTATEDQTLSANTAGISDADGLGTFSYQWLRNGSTIGGAAASTYLLGDADVGAQLSVEVRYTDGGGTAEGPLTSTQVGPVANVNDAPVGVPTISGTVTEDQTLSANTAGISDADGLGTFSYQWLRGGSTIGGATANTYLLGDGVVGAQISVQVSYTDGGGTAEGPLTSALTAVVTNVNDAPVGIPTISGTPTEDQTLTVNTAGISDADGLGAFSYQWLRGGVAIGGATASSYTLGDADVGAQISVQVSYTDGGGTAEGPLTSALVGPVANVNDAPAGLPAITGTPTEDQTLTADTAGISDADGLGTFSYQWLRGGSTIGGATASTYTLGDADVGAQISVQVTYTDGGGTAEGPLTSVGVGPVANVNDTPAGVPTISGTASKGQTLTADASGISDADGLGTFNYQWLRGGVAIGGATGSTYLLVNADVGTQISVQVTYTDGHGTAEGPLTSAPTALVTNVNTPPSGLPTITGTATEDQTLSANTAGISDADGLGAFSYQWLRNGSTIGGATANTYSLGDADVGAQISVRVTYTDGGGTAEGPLTSASVGPVANVNDAPAGVPAITGTASKGQTLTAEAIGISDADGIGTFNYQWLRGGVVIGGATGSTYLLVNADVGTQITVQVTYTDGHGTAEGPLTSVPTALVSDVNTAAEVSGTTSGFLTEDGTLAANGNLTVSDPDTGEAGFVAQAVTAGTYGSFSIDAAGAWTYNLNNAAAVVQQLVAGQTVTDNFTVASADGTTASVTLTIIGVDDATVITGIDSGVVVEDTALSTSGNLAVSASDARQATFKAQNGSAGTYGSFSIDAAGAWNYNLNNAAAVVQQLAAGQTVTDTFTVASADGTTAIVAVTINGTNDAPVMTEATLTLRIGETVVLRPALLGATDVDGPQGNLTFVVTDVVNGHFEQAGESGATISTFSYADLVAGRVRFVHFGNGAAPAFRVAASDGSLTSAPLNARVVLDSASATNFVASVLVINPIAIVGGDGARPDGPGNGAAAGADLAQESAAAEQERGVQGKTGSGESVGDLHAANLERLLSAPSAPAQSPAPVAPRGAMITLDDHTRSAVIEVATDITWDEYYLRLVSLTVADQGSSGRDAKLAAGNVTEASSEATDGMSRELAVSAAQMTGIALTAGTVWWALRVGGLLTSLMASMPAWRHVDPLPILRDDEDEEVDWGNEDAESARDEEAVDQVLDASGRGDQR